MSGWLMQQSAVASIRAFIRPAAGKLWCDVGRRWRRVTKIPGPRPAHPGVRLMLVLILAFAAVAPRLSTAQFTPGPQDPQIAQLQILYDQTNGDNWTNTQANNGRWDFTTTPNPCADMWFGITCGTGDTILEIRLSGNHLTGTIENLDFADLAYLITFDVSNNQIGGFLPGSLDGPPGLAQFDVSNNLIEGPLPPLENALNLFEFNASQNRLSGPIGPLPNDHSLEAFLVAGNELSGHVPPAPVTLESGRSSLCPNQLEPDDDAAWDNATGVSPWHTDCVVPVTIPASERSVLIELYNATNGPGWSNHTGWLGPVGTECNWYGVACDGQGEHVTQINLPGNTLTGTLPPSLAGLPQLQIFDVSGNQLTGGVPTTGANLLPGQSALCPNNLDPVPNTAWDSATGVTPWYQDCVVPTTIPSSERSALMELYNSTNGPGWADNTGWGDAPGTECSWYGITCDGQGEHVTQINLPGNTLTGTLPPSLAGLPQLQIFDVSGNQLTGGVPSTGDNLLPGQSALCPNDFDPLISATWDAATGNDPWYVACGHQPPVPVVVNTVDDGFDPAADDEVRALAVQADGRIVAGGQFTTMAGELRQRLARLLPDGKLDPEFARTGVNGAVEAIVVQTDGRIVLAGRFTAVGGRMRYRVARLNADGSLDTAFAPVVSGDVYALALQPDGRIVLGGNFTQVNGQGTRALARLNADGSLDTGFNAQVTGTVAALAARADGSLVVGGTFTQVNGHAKRNVARVRSDGTLDWRFVPEPDGAVRSLALQPDGGVVVGGAFNTTKANAFANLIRVTGSGRLDVGFAPTVNGAVSTVLQQADGKWVIGGSFTQVNGQPRAHIARLNLDGSLDAVFDPGSQGAVLALAQQPDASVLLGGAFDRVAGQPRERLARVYPDGSLDTTLDVMVEHAHLAQLEYVGVQPDGRVLLGGVFERVDTQPEYQLVRLWPDGRVDGGFNPGLEDALIVNSAAVLPDGKILVAGSFGASGAQVTNNIRRLNADGSIDESFVAGTDSWVKALTVQRDGKILIGGKFDSVNGVPRTGLARLHADGSLDASFAPGTNDRVGVIVPLPDQQLLIAGHFTQVGGLSRNYLARLRPDGRLDPTFNAQIGAQQYDAVLALLAQRDGKIVVGGQFQTIAGHHRSGLARLDANGGLDLDFDPTITGHAQTVLTLAARADGKFLAGGMFEAIAGEVRKSVALVNENGSVDAAWIADTDADGFLTTLAIQADGKALMGGRFSQVAGQARGNVARAAFSEAALQSLSLTVSGADPGSVSWSRAGTAPELASAPVLLSSLDGVHFQLEGVMRKQGGVWRYDDLVPPLNRNFWLRAQARTANGRSNGGLIQSTRLAWAGFSDLQVENLTQVRMAGKSGWRFDLVNRAPAATDDIIIVTDADTVERMAFVPVCTADTVNGVVAVRCQRPSELGIQCDVVGMGERQCSIANLPEGAARSFFVQPADPDIPTIPMTILVNGSVAGQQPLTP